jgi:hypothetical protein
MDRITKSLLSEFCSEHDLERQPEDKQFEHFASYLAVSRNHNETFDTADVVIGAGNDLGIDGIACIVNGTLVTDPEMIPELVQTNGGASSKRAKLYCSVLYAMLISPVSP